MSSRTTKETPGKSSPDFVWADDEVELLQRVTSGYKVSRAVENVGRASCQTKYNDILDRCKEQYQAAASPGKDHLHKLDDVTKTKLEAIRRKYRQAVDARLKSGHGRVHGSFPRREKRSARLSRYRREKLKRKLPNNGRLLALAQEDLKLETQILERMEATDRAFMDSMTRLTMNIEKLTNSVVEGFAMMINMMAPPQYFSSPQYPPHSHYHSYTYGHTDSRVAPPTSSPLPQRGHPGNISYSHSLFTNERDDSYD